MRSVFAAGNAQSLQQLQLAAMAHGYLPDAMVAQNWQHRMLAGHQEQANTIMGQRTGSVRSARSALRDQMMLMASALPSYQT